jgi:hypothetical protein
MKKKSYILALFADFDVAAHTIAALRNSVDQGIQDEGRHA